MIVTHNMQQAARVSDYTAYMYLGEMIEFNDTGTLFTNPGEKMTERLHHRTLWLGCPGTDFKSVPYEWRVKYYEQRSPPYFQAIR